MQAPRLSSPCGRQNATPRGLNLKSGNRRKTVRAGESVLQTRICRDKNATWMKSGDMGPVTDRFHLARVRICAKRAGRSMPLPATDRKQFQAPGRNRATGQRRLPRGIVVVLAADSVCANEILRRAGNGVAL